MKNKQRRSLPVLLFSMILTVSMIVCGSMVYGYQTANANEVVGYEISTDETAIELTDTAEAAGSAENTTEQASTTEQTGSPLTEGNLNGGSLRNLPYPEYYYVTETGGTAIGSGSGGSYFAGQYETLEEAFNAVNNDIGSGYISYSIVATADDSSVGTTAELNRTGVEITLSSASSNKISQASGRHIKVTDGSLILSNIVLDGDDLGGGIEVSTGGSLTIGSGAVIQNCEASEYGGGVNSKGPVTVDGGKVINNNVNTDYSSQGGGGIYCEAGVIVKNGAEISGNTTTKVSSGITWYNYGGGIYSTGPVTVDGSTISNNSSDYGGGIYLVTSTAVASLNKALFDGNIAKHSGGGLYVGNDASLTVENYTTFSGNQATNYGGAIYTVNSPKGGGNYSNLNIDATTTFSGNVAISISSTPTDYEIDTLYGAYIARNLSNSLSGNGVETPLTNLDVNYEPQYVTITYDPNGGTGALYLVPSVQKYSEYSILTAAAAGISASGTSVFKEWNTQSDGSGKSYNSGNSYNIHDDITIYAQWAKVFSVTYHSSFGTDVTEQASVSQISPNYVVLDYGNTALPVRSGYVFDGWEDGSGAKYAAGAVITVSSNIDLYAQWSPVKYTVTYHSNFGTDVTMPVSVSESSLNHTVLSYDGTGLPEQAGYVFDGWKDGNGAIRNAGEVITINSDLDLYAKWSPAPAPVTYTITYHSNFGTDMTEQDSVSNQNYGILSYSDTALPEQSGNVFDRWNTQADGSGTDYSKHDAVTLNSNLDLYAQWVPVKYTVTYHSNFGTDETVPVPVSESNLNYTVLDYGVTGLQARTGYVFAGWNTRADGSGTSYNVDNVITLGSDIDLYAQWLSVKFSVTYYTNDGTNTYVWQKGYNYEASHIVQFETVPTRRGYVFTGWNTQADGNGKAYKPDDSEQSRTITINEHVSLYAMWEPAAAYSVTYYVNGGSGTALTISNIPANTVHSVLSLSSTGITRSGYNFTGWNTQSDGSGTGYNPGDAITLTSDIGLYAQWKSDGDDTGTSTTTAAETSAAASTTAAAETSSASGSAHTGDHTNAIVYLMIIAAGILALIIYSKKKQSA